MFTRLVCLTTLSCFALACSSDPEPSGNADASSTVPDAGGGGNPDATAGNPDATAGDPDAGGGGGDAGGGGNDSGMMQPNALGCRNFNVRTGEDGDEANNTVFFTTAFNSPETDLSEFIDAKGWQVGGPLVLCAGAIEAGKAAITLQSDVTFAVSLPLDNCLCRTYVAAGSTGSLYCGASTDFIDFKQTVDSMGEGTEGAVSIAGGPAAVMAEGSVRVTLQSKATSITAAAPDCTPAACATAAAAEELLPTDYTTGVAISEITNARQMNQTIQIPATGIPFDDDPTDGTADCEDWLNTNVKGALAGAPGFDFDNDDIGIKDVVTVERLAE